MGIVDNLRDRQINFIQKNWPQIQRGSLHIAFLHQLSKVFPTSQLVTLSLVTYYNMRREKAMRLPGPCSDEGMSQCCHSTLWQQTSLAMAHMLMTVLTEHPDPDPLYATSYYDASVNASGVICTFGCAQSEAEDSYPILKSWQDPSISHCPLKSLKRNQAM